MILTLSAGWDLPPASLAHLGTQGRVLLPSSCLPSSSSSDRPGSSPAASAPHTCYCFCGDWALSDLLPLPVPCSCSVQILQPRRGPGPPDKPGFVLISLVAPHYSFLNRFFLKKKKRSHLHKEEITYLISATSTGLWALWGPDHVCFIRSAHLFSRAPHEYVLYWRMDQMADSRGVSKPSGISNSPLLQVWPQTMSKNIHFSQIRRSKLSYI